MIKDNQNPICFGKPRVPDGRPDVLMLDRLRPDNGNIDEYDEENGENTLCFAADPRFTYDDA